MIRALSKAQLAAYIAEQRAAAASRAELSYAGFLSEFAFARDKDIDQVHRLAAYRFATVHLARITPLAAAVAEATGEATLDRAARLTIGLLEAIMAGRLPSDEAWSASEPLLPSGQPGACRVSGRLEDFRRVATR
ncbi:MAG: hypothetical protein AB7O95_05910 [Geminicoccaceae bacterium]